MAKKYVYLFKEGNANMRELLGGKGANLAEMTNLGMPVPQGLMTSSSRFTMRLPSPKRSPARSLATTRTPSWFLFVPAPALPCLA